MRIIEYLHTALILVVSTVLALSLVFSAQRAFFASVYTYYIHATICFLLIIMALIILFCHFKAKTKVKVFQIAWWLPQLFVIFISNHMTNPVETYSLYFMPYPFFMPLKFSIAISSKKVLAVALNIAPVMAIFINLILIWLSYKKEKYNPAVQVTSRGWACLINCSKDKIIRYLNR